MTQPTKDTKNVKREKKYFTVHQKTIYKFFDLKQRVVKAKCPTNSPSTKIKSIYGRVIITISSHTSSIIV